MLIVAVKGSEGTILSAKVSRPMLSPIVALTSITSALYLDSVALLHAGKTIKASTGKLVATLTLSGRVAI